MTDGARALSTAKSAKGKCIFGSNLDSHSTVISPDLQKPKKVVVAAAHSMMLLKKELSSNQTLRSL